MEDDEERSYDAKFYVLGGGKEMYPVQPGGVQSLPETSLLGKLEGSGDIRSTSRLLRGDNARGLRICRPFACSRSIEPGGRGEK